MTPAQTADQFNDYNPIGTRVIVVDDFGKDFNTTTRSEAWATSNNVVVILVDGMAAPRMLGRVRVKGGGA